MSSIESAGPLDIKPGRKIKIGNFEIQLIRHSRNPSGLEAITFQWTYERIIHAQVMTHRWSRNASSSRAIPIGSMLKWIDDDPGLPLHLGRNRSGMQSGEEIGDAEEAKIALLNKYQDARSFVKDMSDRFGLHKEILNRYVEPWGWITSVATMGQAQFFNWIALRCTEHAESNVQRVAINSLRLYAESTPQRLEPGDWHVPYFDDYIPYGLKESEPVRTALIWSTARAAWCSYNHPTKEATFEDAKIRHDSCVADMHATPLEHALMAHYDNFQHGAVPGYSSYRMMLPRESVRTLDVAAVLKKYGDRDYLVAV